MLMTYKTNKIVDELLFVYRMVHMLEERGMEGTFRWYAYTSDTLGIPRAEMNTLINRILRSIKKPQKARRYIAKEIIQYIPELGWTIYQYRDILRLPRRAGLFRPCMLRKLIDDVFKVPEFTEYEHKIIITYLKGMEEIRRII